MKKAEVISAFPSLYDVAYKDGYRAAIRKIRRLIRHELAIGESSLAAFYRKLEKEKNKHG